jgi:hypothetical protein
MFGTLQVVGELIRFLENMQKDTIAEKYNKQPNDLDRNWKKKKDGSFIYVGENKLKTK